MLQRAARVAVSKPLQLCITAPSAQTRNAASSSSCANDAPSRRRRAVTVVNDTGAVPWKDLSLGEKAARTTQQSFNLGLVLLGIGLTGAVAAVLWLEVFSADSQTAYFNRAADRIRADARCREMLTGESTSSKRQVQAYGEPSGSRWARNRTIASRTETDSAGTEHLHMHFYVQGKAATGTVNLHMTRRPGGEFHYQLLALDVPGQPRYHLENAGGIKEQRKLGRMFGVNWSR